MKQAVTALIIAAILAIAPSVMAAGVKAPKLLCLRFDDGEDREFIEDYHQLSFKSSGTITEPDSETGKAIKVTTYAITGRVLNSFDNVNFPVSGSGYILPESTILHMTYTGLGTIDEDKGTLCSYELEYDLTEGVEKGSLMYRYNNNEDNNTSYGIDCESMFIK